MKMDSGKLLPWAMTLRITTFSIMALSIVTFSITIKKWQSTVMLSATYAVYH